MTDADFLAAFRSQSIAHSDWNHRAHVRTAYLHAREMSFGEALIGLRDGIRKLNAAQGVVETPERGYHETLTRAWLTVITAAIRAWDQHGSFEEFIAEHPHLLCRTLLRLYYSPKGMPPNSRYEFVAPDLAPFPHVE